MDPKSYARCLRENKSLKASLTTCFITLSRPLSGCLSTSLWYQGSHLKHLPFYMPPSSSYTQSILPSGGSRASSRTFQAWYHFATLEYFTLWGWFRLRKVCSVCIEDLGFTMSLLEFVWCVWICWLLCWWLIELGSDLHVILYSKSLDIWTAFLKELTKTVRIEVVTSLGSGFPALKARMRMTETFEPFPKLP